MSLAWPARLFGPGLPATGVEAQARLEHGFLSFEYAGGQRTLPLAAVQLSQAGFDGRQWQIAWQDAGAPWALLVSDAAAIDQLRQAGNALSQSLRKQEGSATRRRRIGFGALLVWLAMPLLLIGGLVLAAKPLTVWAVSRIPMRWEVQLGERSFAAQHVTRIEGTAANEALVRLGGELTRGAAYHYRWYIANDPTLNAYAVPGGIVVVHSGLIRATDSPNELAGVLAHEIEHVEQRHSLRALAQQTGLKLTFALLFGDPGFGAEAAGQLGLLKFSRDQETEADLAGLARLKRAEISTAGMLSFFAKLQNQNQLTPPAWLSTHPQTPQRLNNLRKAGASLSDSEPAFPELDWAAVKDSLPAATP